MLFCFITAGTVSVSQIYRPLFWPPPISHLSTISFNCHPHPLYSLSTLFHPPSPSLFSLPPSLFSLPPSLPLYSLSLNKIRFGLGLPFLLLFTLFRHELLSSSLLLSHFGHCSNQPSSVPVSPGKFQGILN